MDTIDDKVRNCFIIFIIKLLLAPPPPFPRCKIAENKGDDNDEVNKVKDDDANDKNVIMTKAGITKKKVLSKKKGGGQR